MKQAAPVIWTPNARAASADGLSAPLPVAMARGWRGRCPVCGQGAMFCGWLRVRAACEVCGMRLGDVRADDAPAYFTVFIAGHFIVALLLALESMTTLPVPVELAILVPVAVALTLLLIRPVKGATVALMCKLGLTTPQEATDPLPGRMQSDG